MLQTATKSILYRTENCQLKEPVAVIEGPVTLGRTSAPATAAEDGVFLLPFWPDNSWHQAAWARVGVDGTFKLLIGSRCQVAVDNQLVRTQYRLDHRCTVRVARHTLRLDHRQHDQVTFRLQPGSPEAVIDLKRGQVTLVFEEGDAFRIVPSSTLDHEVVFAVNSIEFNSDLVWMNGFGFFPA